MSIQFAGSKSLDDRRRRRLVAHADDPALGGGFQEDGAPGAGVASELVASAAAAPWVPVHEWRIWTFAAIVGLVLIGSAFALARPTAFRPELAPLTKPLLQSPRPVLGVLIQTLFWFLSAELAILIGWYRAQCKLDFRGRYRVWPWAAAMFAMAALCSATNAHHLFGQVVARAELLRWRPDVVSWLLPACALFLPLAVLLDRDVRRSRSSLYTLRAAFLVGFGSACLELFAADLVAQAWFEPTRTIVPMFGTAILFLGLWLHARIVAYVCPDPPEASEQTAAAQILTVWGRLVSLVRAVLSWRPRPRAAVEPEVEVKPKRGRKKATADDEEEEPAAPKRKRRTPTKRAAKPRSRAKVVEEEVDESEEEQQFDDSSDSSYSDESYENSYGDDDSSEQNETGENEWQEEEEEEETPAWTPPKRPSPPQSSSPPARKSPEPVRSSSDDSEESSEEDEESEDAIFRRDSGMTAEQMKGLSKRQKRDLRRQLREQQRNQRR